MMITMNDAKIIIGMVARGDKQHDIAAWFGENQARIAEAANGDYGTLEAAPENSLPPRGAPGIKGRRLIAFVEKAIQSLEEGNIALAKQHLNDGVERFNRHE